MQLSRGTRVRLIGSVQELKRLCERPAPGAGDSVRWNDQMSQWAGEACTVVRMGDAEHANYVLQREATPGSRPFSFPYDALSLEGAA